MGKLHQDKKNSVNNVGMVGIGVGIGKVNKEYALKVENSYFVEWEGKDGSAVHKELLVLDDEGVVLDVNVGSTADAVSGKVGKDNNSDMQKERVHSGRVAKKDMLTALTKHILEEGGKKLIIFDDLEHNILDTLSRYARVSKSVSKKVDGLGLTTSLSTNIKLSHSSIRGLISLHNRRKSKSKKRKEKKKVEKDIRIKIGNSIP